MGGSHFIEARRNDPELVEQRLVLEDAAGDTPTPPWRPAGTEWTQADELQSKILDRLGEILAVLASQPLPRKAKPKKPPPAHPRPTRGVDVARARRRVRYLAELDQEVEEAQARWRKANPPPTT